MWARFLLVSVFDRKPGGWSNWWHFVCLWTCSSLDLWSVSVLSNHLLRMSNQSWYSRVLALPYRRKPDAKKIKKGMERHAERKTAFVQRVIYGYFLILIKQTNVCHRCCVIIEVETASIINLYATKSIIVKNDSLEYTPKMNISLINPFALFWQSWPRLLYFHLFMI